MQRRWGTGMRQSGPRVLIKSFVISFCAFAAHTEAESTGNKDMADAKQSKLLSPVLVNVLLNVFIASFFWARPPRIREIPGIPGTLNSREFLDFPEIPSGIYGNLIES